MKILCIKLRAIGDTVIWTAALSALREQFPDSEIHVLTHQGNLAVLEKSMAIDSIHLVKPGSRGSLLTSLWKLRSERFDWVIGFHATQSLCRWAWLVGAKKMVLHHHSWGYTPRGSERLNRPGALLNAIERDFETLKGMGFDPQLKVTTIEIAASEAEWAENKMKERIASLGEDINKPRFLFLPGASHALRRYPKDQWWALIEDVKREGRYQPVILCDDQLARDWNLKEECDRANIPLFAEGSLREFIVLIARGQRALANDSGPGHIAVAVGVQTDFIFGPGCVGDWFPYSAPHKVHRIVVPCREQGPRQLDHFQFCTVDRCEHHTCMRELGVRLS